MQRPFSVSASSRANNRRQAYAMLLPGVVFLGIAWLGMFNTYSVLVPFALSLWLPGSGLFALGLVCLATSGRTTIHAKRHLVNCTDTNVHNGSIAVHPANEDGR
jgi:hypothetical protein